MPQDNDYDVASKMDLPAPDTLDQAVRERNGWINTAAMHHQNETYYRGLLTQIAEMLGADAYTADDGTVHDSPLCIKVPELVAKRLGGPDAMEAAK